MEKSFRKKHGLNAKHQMISTKNKKFALRKLSKDNKRDIPLVVRYNFTQASQGLLKYEIRSPIIDQIKERFRKKVRNRSWRSVVTHLAAQNKYPIYLPSQDESIIQEAFKTQFNKRAIKIFGHPLI